MKTSIVKVCQWLSLVIIALFMNMIIESVLIGVIAIAKSLPDILHRLHNISKNEESPELQGISEQSSRSKAFILTEYCFLFKILAGIASVTYFIVKTMYLGLNYSVYSIFQSVVLFVILVPIELSFATKYLILLAPKHKQYDHQQYISAKAHKIIKSSLSINFGILITILSALIMGWPLFSTTQILLLKLASDISLLLIFVLDSFIHRQKSLFESESKRLNLHNTDLLNIVATGLLMAFLSLISYKVGLNTGNISTAITMAFYTLLLTGWFVGIGNWIRLYNKIKGLLLSFNIIVLSLIIQLSVLFLPVFHNLFHTVQLSRNNWNQVALTCSFMLLYTVLINVVGAVWRNKEYIKLNIS